MKNCILRIPTDVAYVNKDKPVKVTLENIGDPGDFSVSMTIDGSQTISDSIHMDRMKKAEVDIPVSEVKMDEPRPINIQFVVTSSGESIARSNKLMTVVPECWSYINDEELADSLVSSLPVVEAVPESSVYDDASDVFDEISWYEYTGIGDDLYFRTNPLNEVIEDDSGDEIELAILFMYRMLKKGHASRMYNTPEGCFVCMSDDPSARFPDDYLIVRPSDACNALTFDESCDASKQVVRTLSTILKGSRYLSKTVRPSQ